MKTLLIAIGNSGRADDGLGWAFAELCEEKFPEILDIEFRYQLQVEDAELVSKYSKVFFVDASVEEIENGFNIEKIQPATEYFFSSHLQSSEAILYLCQTIYNKTPESFLIKIQGKNWGLKLGLSETAEENLGESFEEFAKIHT